MTNNFSKKKIYIYDSFSFLYQIHNISICFIYISYLIAAALRDLRAYTCVSTATAFTRVKVSSLIPYDFSFVTHERMGVLDPLHRC